MEKLVEIPIQINKKLIKRICGNFNNKNATTFFIKIHISLHKELQISPINSYRT
jgi:hypothetical protein